MNLMLVAALGMFLFLPAMLYPEMRRKSLCWLRVDDWETAFLTEARRPRGSHLSGLPSNEI
ncbi:hypothetical protein CA601_02630 [Paraburkholderia hospita]|nr:hypothetical protein CA602_27115 [Paraburkholderia hospita]OUL96358.1 hypothetical protein CA601_02630 [Paraburkholderia hospita]